MTLVPIFHEGKQCMVYCGDERCNCDKSPNYTGYDEQMQKVVDELVKQLNEGDYELVPEKEMD